MKAIVQSAYGSSEEVHWFREEDTPTPGVGMLRTACFFLLLLLIAAFPLAAESERVQTVSVHTEFLWAPSAPKDLARAWAQGFLLGEDSEHRICLKLSGHPEAGEPVRIEVFDGAGERVATDEYHHPGGPETRVRCRSAQTHHVDAAPGVWTYRRHIGEGHVGESRIEVAASLEEADFYGQPNRPYIVGRTNYSESISAHYRGEVVFDMSVNAAGRVVHAEVVSPAELATVIAERIHAAAALYRFPADPGRQQKPLRIRQTVTLSNE